MSDAPLGIRTESGAWCAIFFSRALNHVDTPSPSRSGDHPILLARVADREPNTAALSAAHEGVAANA